METHPQSAAKEKSLCTIATTQKRYHPKGVQASYISDSFRVAFPTPPAQCQQPVAALKHSPSHSLRQRCALRDFDEPLLMNPGRGTKGIPLYGGQKEHL